MIECRRESEADHFLRYENAAPIMTSDRRWNAAISSAAEMRAVSDPLPEVLAASDTGVAGHAVANKAT
jgi:hypothetical protein